MTIELCTHSSSMQASDAKRHFLGMSNPLLPAHAFPVTSRMLLRFSAVLQRNLHLTASTTVSTVLHE